MTYELVLTLEQVSKNQIVEEDVLVELTCYKKLIGCAPLIRDIIATLVFEHRWHYLF